MKTTFLTLVTLASIPLRVLAQGTIAIDNLNGFDGPTATSFGLFFNSDETRCTAPRINITVWGGPTPGSLVPIATLAGAKAMIYVFDPGMYMDPAGDIYAVPGVALGSHAVLQVFAWTGSATNFADAPIHNQFWPWNGTAYVDPASFMFVNETGGPFPPPGSPYGPPRSLDGMPALALIPEPPITILTGLGLAALWVANRRTRTA